MKSLYLRAVMAIVCAVGLAACGGGSGTLVLGGTVSGLVKDGLVLTNNNADTVTIAAGSTTFAFSNLIATDDQFNVTIKTQPTGAVCSISGTTGSGKANLYNTDYIVVSCVTNSYTLGGTISGLTGTGLVLVNGADSFSPAVPADPSAATPFTMPSKVADGSVYGVTVLSQPTNGQTCLVANGTGTMGSTAIAPIVVTCT